LSRSTESCTYEASSSAPGVEVGAERRELVADAQRRARGGALVEHAHRHRRDARRAGAVGREAAVEQQAHAHHRHRVAPDEHHLEPARERGALGRREAHLGRRRGRRHRLAVDVAGHGRELRERAHLQHVAPRREPAAGGVAQLLGRRALDEGQVPLVRRGVAAQHLAARQHVALAAEAADALGAAHEAGAVLRLHARQLLRRRAVAHEAGELVVHGALHGREVAARLGGGGRDELAADLARCSAGWAVGMCVSI
jgi:hypothetical protein